jgi:hypothetical protein
MPGSSSGLFSSGFLTKTLYTTLHTCYMPRPSHSSRFDHPNNIGWAVQIIKRLTMQFYPLPCYLVPLRPICSPQHSILKPEKIVQNESKLFWDTLAQGLLRSCLSFRYGSGRD